MRLPLLALALGLAATPLRADDGNRLAYLDDADPYYPHRTFPKLVTPQWVGEDGVDAVVVLAIDDMRGPDKWEAYLRPILERLKKIDGRAPVSIMTCQVDPKHPHLQVWLKEGLSLETHTVDHPCPLLRKGDFQAARSTVDRCIDQLAQVPNSRPVAFRTPCCDSLNTVSPRLFAEILDRRTTPKGNYLQLDSSVFTVFTADDPELPRELVTDPDGGQRFLKYLPADRQFVNYIENYPYPYPIGRLWEFPCVTPSDWSAQHRHKPKNPVTLRDWQAALDATVVKNGTFNLVFHPYDWIGNGQVVELIDYAQRKYGKRVKFLTFREALERLDKNLLAGEPLRDPGATTAGLDNGVRLLDVNGDGYMDVVIGSPRMHKTRVWNPAKKGWDETDFPPVSVVDARFGVVGGKAVVLANTPDGPRGWRFDGGKWAADDSLAAGLPRQLGAFRLLDLDGDRQCELIAEGGRSVFGRAPGGWAKLPFALPDGLRLATPPNSDTGMRFTDLDGDGKLDLLFADESRFGVYLFQSLHAGWRTVSAGKAGEPGALPPIAVNGTNNGAFVRGRWVYWQNENTDLLKDLIDRRSFNDLLASVEPTAKSPEQSL